VATAFLSWLTKVTGGTSQRTYPDRLADFVKVNEFYPANAGTVHDLNSHPLSGYYSSLAAAQVDYPFATSLTNEVDWCAWMAALLYIYVNQPVGGPGRQNGGTLYADGCYVVDQTIQCNIAAIEIVGSANFQGSGGYGTQVKYNGVAGTQDAPIYIFDFWTVAEDAATYAT
jgi:hypothetical protein